MKTILFFVLCVMVSSANAQSLKDALFSGKLKTDSGSVIKKTDSLQLLPDSVIKARKDSLQKITVQNNTAKDSVTAPMGSVNKIPEDNNTAWQKFIDEYSEVIKKDVLPSKKIKEGTYSVLLEYYIETNGSITDFKVYCTPESDYLVEQIKVRMMMNAPQLKPLLMSNGKPRRALKKQTLTFVKE